MTETTTAPGAAEQDSEEAVGAAVRHPDGVRRLLISSPKGGSTKTTTARNIAVLAALDGLRTATVDFDRQKSLTEWWSIRPEAAVPITHYDAAFEDAEDVADISDADIVVIDTPPGIEDHPTAMRTLLRMAHLVLVPTLQNDDDIKSVIPWMRFLRSQGVNAAFLIGAASRRTLSLDQAKRRLVAAGRLCPIEIPRYEDVPQSARVGLGVAEVRRARGADDFRGVWSFVRSELGFSS